MSEKSSLITELEALQEQAEQELAGLTSESDLQNWRTQFLGPFRCGHADLPALARSAQGRTARHRPIRQPG